MLKEIGAMHQKMFARPGRAFAAPARVNLIGEHTDYSEGFVMPAAIDFATYAVISPRSDSRAVIYSANFSETVEVDLNSTTLVAKQHWSDYPIGVLWSLKKEGVPIGGFEMAIHGDVPVGAGLSSSASIEVAVALAVLSQTKTTLPLARIAQLCQRAENEFVGANSGIMDQFVVCFGETGHAIVLDCRSLEHRSVPIPRDVQLVLCNSMVQHSVAGGEYNTRRAEVEEGVRILQQQHPAIRFLRDATEEQLLAARDRMPDNVFRRCRHVITENRRVLEAAEALDHSDLVTLGRLLGEAHRSYRDDFEASCEEVDVLVELADQHPGCYGSRLTGGGFGGCTVNLVRESEVDSFIDFVHKGYRSRTGIDAEIYNCRASAGAHEVDQ